MLGCFPFINAHYDSPGALDGGWCFVVPNQETSSFWILFWYWFSFYAWIWCAFLVVILFYIVIIFKLAERLNKVILMFDLFHFISFSFFLN
jgi:hypothetical protein